MNFFLKQIIFVLIIISWTNKTVLSDDKSLQLHIANFLTSLNSTSVDAILYWNAVALQACANDHDTTICSTTDQVGPTAGSRAFAIIHGAMYDSMAIFNQSLKPVYKLDQIPNLKNISKDSAANAAIMESAYQTLLAMYPKQRTIFDAIRKNYYNQLKMNGNRSAIAKGIIVGKLVSSFILTKRQNDHSQDDMSYTPMMYPGYHQADPTHPDQGFLGPKWGRVTPFFLDYPSQFRPSNIVGMIPTDRLRYLNSTDYINDFNEVKLYGSKNSTMRTDDQTEIGIFWAYDGVPKLGVPPRLYNQIVRIIAIQQNNTLEDNARLFALINYAMADAAIAAWECKYYYNLWRPIVGIRQAIGATQPDPHWLPLGAPCDKMDIDFTPSFPSYVSGHSTFGSAVFESLRQFYKRDNIPFEFQSDEYNGKTYDANLRSMRAAKTGYYQSFSQAETENYLSRIYLGVHWRIDQEEGKILGQKIAKFIYNEMN